MGFINDKKKKFYHLTKKKKPSVFNSEILICFPLKKPVLAHLRFV